LIEEVAPNIFKVEIPLPHNPLRFLNSYFIKGSKRTLIVDTGFNMPECKEAMHNALDELDIDLHETDFFITHIHADHSGLVAELTNGAPSAKVYCNKIDAVLINEGILLEYWHKVGELFRVYGFPQELLDDALIKHPAKNYCIERVVDFTFVDDGCRIGIDPYNFVCIATPGHSPGHMCLYEPEKKIFLAGDHILAKITPNITQWTEIPDTLAQYFKSLDRVYDMDINLLLPGHRQIIRDHRQRINELRQHHDVRLQEILNILDDGPQSAYQVAAKMTWSLSYKRWDDFPMPQKWFANGEAASHLEYLTQIGKLHIETKDGVYLFIK